MPQVQIFDGHNDALYKLVLAAGQGRELDFLNGAAELHIDLIKARAGGFAGGLFAMFANEALGGGTNARSFGVAGPLAHQVAKELTGKMIAYAKALADSSDGAVQICTSVKQIRAAMTDSALALVLHIEGAEAVSADLNELQGLYDLGLRSIGPVWSRNNVFAHGVPFKFPGSPDQGDGLTDAGRELVKRCNAMGILLDLSHMNEQGFWDIADLSDKPLVASHSNVHAICPSPRNLTDRQLEAIAQSGGLVGLNFAVGFLREDGGHSKTDVPISMMIRHLDYLLEKLGEDGVGIGSDFDGCKVPDEIKDASGLPKLVAAMQEAGYGDALITKICRDNWLSVLERTWGA